MRAILSLILLYLVIGVVVVGIQVSSSPCDTPVVLDPLHTNITTRLNGTLFGPDNEVRLRLGKDVVLWLPRLIEFVFRGDMPIDQFINATSCRLPAAFQAPI